MSSSSSSSSSRSRRRVTFLDTDTVVPIPPLPEAASEAERPQVISSYAPPSHSFTHPMSTLATSSFYTPHSNSERNISIEGQDRVTADSGPMLLRSDAVVRLEAKALDTDEPHALILHSCLTVSNPIQWNMLINPQIRPQPQALDQFGQDSMIQNEIDESISKIRIICDNLPWQITIDIDQDGPDRSPRVEDIPNSIYTFLWKLASSVDLDNQTTERQREIKKSYQRRCRQISVDEKTNGLRRIDFLEGQTMFFGLSPGDHEDELWLHVGSEY